MSNSELPLLGELERLHPAAVRLLSTPSPHVDAEDAARVARDAYGIGASAQLMPGERDRNFLLRGDSGDKWVLKFYNHADDGPERDFQHGALLHIAQSAPDCPVPRLIPTLDDTCEFHASVGGHDHVGVLISYIDGANAVGVAPTPRLRHSIGHALAQVADALSSYRHERARRVMLWDHMQVHHLQALVPHLPSTPTAKRVADFVHAFEEETLPRARALPSQIIHNDGTGSNVLLARDNPESVIGIIDFGDMVHAPTINDVAVTSSYFTSEGGDIADEISDVVCGYESRRPFCEDAIALLPDLIRARLATRVLLYEWRSLMFPENRKYILRNSEGAWSLLEALDQYSTSELSDLINRNRRRATGVKP